jgi:hypothetical protein
MIADGAWENSPTYMRLRVLTTDGKVGTLFGTKPFFNGDGSLNRSVIMGTFKGIYYKKSTEPNSGATAFPEGLYFMDSSAMILGRIKTDNTSEAMWGNQFNLGSFAAGTTASNSVSMGLPYAGGNGYPLYFDDQGLPMSRASNSLVRLDATRKIEIPSAFNGTGNGYWDRFDDGDAVAGIGLAVNGGKNNLTGIGRNIFLFGDYYNANDSWYVSNTITKMLWLDFTTTAKAKLVMKGSALASTNPAASPNSAVGAAKTSGFSVSCSTKNGQNCYQFYDTATGRLYFSEDNKLRYITTPTNTATSQLLTLFTADASVGNIYNFVFTSDRTKVWFLNSTGALYCKLLSGTASWCDGVTNYNTLGSFANITPTPNQLTWKNDTTLFISTGNGLILQFTPPTGP